MSKPLAKSLHTVTVLARTARFLRDLRHAGKNANDTAMDEALSILGYSRDNDPHRLIPLALKAMDSSP